MKLQNTVKEIKKEHRIEKQRLVSVFLPSFELKFCLSDKSCMKFEEFHCESKSESNLPTNCLSVFDHFVGFALKGLSI